MQYQIRSERQGWPWRQDGSETSGGDGGDDGGRAARAGDCYIGTWWRSRTHSHWLAPQPADSPTHTAAISNPLPGSLLTLSQRQALNGQTLLLRPCRAVVLVGAQAHASISVRSLTHLPSQGSVRCRTSPVSSTWDNGAARRKLTRPAAPRRCTRWNYRPAGGWDRGVR